MSFLEAVQSVYRNYANFSGRATRHEFWWFIVFYVAVSIIFALVIVALGGPGSTMYTIGFGALGLFYLVTLIPYIAVAVRRLHDTNRSGWWLLISFIPLGGLVLLIFWAMAGTPGPNSHGPDPRMAAGYA